MMNTNKIPTTFRKRMIAYNLLMISCIACIISIYTYSFYRKDAIASERASICLPPGLRSPATS